MERRVKQDHNCADSWSDRTYLLISVPKFVLKNLGMDYMDYAVFL